MFALVVPGEPESRLGVALPVGSLENVTGPLWLQLHPSQRCVPTQGLDEIRTADGRQKVLASNMPVPLRNDRGQDSQSSGIQLG